MKYHVHGSGSIVRISVDQIGSKRAAVLKEFNECAEGRCTCPTTQYEKVESMRVTPGQGRLSITLTAKPGETIDHADITRCLENTTRKLEQS